MANAYDLYLSPEINFQINEMLQGYEFQIKTKPKKLADGNQGCNYTVSKKKESMSILETPPSANCTSRYLLCLAKSKNWPFLMEVVSILKTKGATNCKSSALENN